MTEPTIPLPKKPDRPYICEENTHIMTARTKVFAGLIIVALLTRIAPHYPNFTAMGALAFYGALSTRHLGMSLAAMVGTLMVSDLIINNLIYPTGSFTLMYAGSLFTYAGFAAYSFLGRYAGQGAKSALALVAGSLAFFLISNFGVWVTAQSLYPSQATGLLATYVAAIPFYAPELISTAAFSALAYGAHSWATRTAKA